MGFVWNLDFSGSQMHVFTEMGIEICATLNAILTEPEDYEVAKGWHSKAFLQEYLKFRLFFFFLPGKNLYIPLTGSVSS